MKNPQFVDVNNARTRYFSMGDGDPIVLVHGGHYGVRGSAEDWELNFERLAERHRVIAYDKLGMGFTDNPELEDDFTIESQAVHLRGFLDALGLDGVHLVGHSRGGYPVTRMALDQPMRVATLTIVSSSSVTTPFNPVYAEWRHRAESMEEKEAVRYLISANSYSGDHITETMVDVGVEIGRMDKFAEARDRMAQGQYERFKTGMLERLEVMKKEIADGGLIVPTLLVWGFNDPSATMERCGKPAIDQFFPVVEQCEMHILNQAGHYCFREQPDAFADSLLSFVQRHRQVATK